jgi:hypothetical protein
MLWYGDVRPVLHQSVTLLIMTASVHFDGCDPIIIKGVIALGLRKLIENDSFR